MSGSFGVGGHPEGPQVTGLVHVASTRLATGSGLGLNGHANGHWLRILFSPTSVTGSSATRILFSTNNSNDGHRIRTSGTNASLTYGGFFTGPTETSVPTLTLTSAMVGKLLDCCFVYDQPAGLLRFYLQGIEIGSTSTGGGTYLPSTGSRSVQGSTNSPSSPATDNAIVAIEGGDSYIPTAAEVATANRQAQRRVAQNLPPLAGIPSKTTARWANPHAWNPPSGLKDEIGTQDMTMVTGAASSLGLATISGAWA